MTLIWACQQQFTTSKFYSCPITLFFPLKIYSEINLYLFHFFRSGHILHKNEITNIMFIFYTHKEHHLKCNNIDISQENFI